MGIIELLYVVSSVLLGIAGITLVGLSIRAYAETSRKSMVHLSIGFTLVVAAAFATMISSLMTDFTGARSILLVNNGMTVTGYVFVVYSLVTYN